MGAAISRSCTRSKTGSFWSRKKSAVTSPSSPATYKCVPGDVAGGADIVLKSNVQTPEDPQHRAGEYDEILAWLDWEFRKSDANKDGSLDYHEFMRFVRSLDLKLSTREAYQFYALADRDNDERIVWSEIEQEVPVILAKIYQGLPPSPADWCTMVLPSTNDADSSSTQKDEEQVVYFNKRTSEVRRVRPAEMDAPSGVLSPPASAMAKEAVLENTRTFDELLTWLDWEFKKADFDKNGALSREEVVSFLHGLKLGLGPKELERFSRLADFNGDGVVEWKEVLEMTPLLLQKLYSAIEPGPHDVCVITDAEGRVHYLNKRTGAVTAEPPPGLVVPPPDHEEERTSATALAQAAAEAVGCQNEEAETTTSATALEEGPSSTVSTAADPSLATTTTTATAVPASSKTDDPTSSSADGAGELQRLASAAAAEGGDLAPEV